jgi:SPP1 gp7 family putative phage head morphogenesis protein
VLPARVPGAGGVESLRAVAPALTETVRQEVLDARLAAKRASAEIFQDETDTAGEEPELDEIDHARADAIAAALIAAWLMAGMALVQQKKEDPALGALVAIDFRLRRVAATEVSQSYNEEHDSLASTLDPEQWAKRWDATLDSATCKHCKDLHGTIVGIDEEFPDGEIPGEAHIQCRCSLTVIPIAVAQAMAA